MRFDLQLFVLTVSLLSGCSRSPKDFVVLYSSQDQFYAEPILRDFTAATGIEVRTVFDSESAKTAGLAHRLRAEASHPQCDVFWSNEEMHTRLLAQDGVIATDGWRSAGSRTRRIVINTNEVSLTRAPKSLLELTNSTWNGRVALAYPLFGTTKSHFLALRQLWGEEIWKEWCQGLVRNGAKIVDGNSVVVRLVGKGECLIGLTDSDDVTAGLHQGLPIAALAANEESIAIPSTVAMISRTRHSTAAQTLADYLAKPETIQKLVALGALETTSDVHTSTDHLLRMDWSKALRDAERVITILNTTFIRS